jgi:thiol:disulfide interchange protein DsbD
VEQTQPQADLVGLPRIELPASATRELAAGTQSLTVWLPTTGGQAPPGTYTVSGVLEYQLAGAEERHSAPWEASFVADYGWGVEYIQYLHNRWGLLVFVLLVFGFGVVMGFTPCMYPMIPVTLGVIGARSQERGLLGGFLLSVTYVAGMSLVFAVLGAIVGGAGSAAQGNLIKGLFQSPLFLVPIALLFVVLAFSMFGAFELQLPAFLRDRLQRPGKPRGGYTGALILGVVSGLVASPCVSPFLAALLLWVATLSTALGSAWAGAIAGGAVLFWFGMGLGLMLIAVGTFPGLMKHMPQSGAWLESVKRAMGLLLIGAAFYFVRPPIVLDPTTFSVLLGLTAIIVAVFLGGFDRLSEESGWWMRTRKALGVALVVVGGALLAGAILQQYLPQSPAAQPPRMAAATPPDSAQAGPPTGRWIKTTGRADPRAYALQLLEEAREAGKPVVLDFYADWCTGCHELDEQTFSDARVQQALQDFVLIKLDHTKRDDQRALLPLSERFKTSGGMPAVVLIDSQGDFQASRNIYQAMDPERFIRQLERVDGARS